MIGMQSCTAFIPFLTNPVVDEAIEKVVEEGIEFLENNPVKETIPTNFVSFGRKLVVMM
jgi:hypothetical protein